MGKYKNLPMWLNGVIVLCTVVGTVWAAEARFNQDALIKTLDNSVRANALAIQLHQRDDISTRVVQLQAKDRLTESERKEVLFYQQRLTLIDRIIIKLDN